MSNEIIFIVEDSSEGGYEAKALPHPIFTEGDTLDDCALWCAMPCSATLSYGDREEHVARHRWGRRLAGLVAFEFHAKTRQGAVVYRCRLNGPDEDWRTTRATRVEYEGLTAGGLHLRDRRGGQRLVRSVQPATAALEVLHQPLSSSVQIASVRTRSSPPTTAPTHSSPSARWSWPTRIRARSR
jgi:hypothetical protein